MERNNRFLSFELLFALLIIISFFLPWVDYGFVKVVGWDIPSVQKTMTKVSNIFSKNKSSIYTTYAIYLIPFFSVLLIALWIMLKQKAARVLLALSGMFGFTLSIYLFFKLPKVGSGVYLLSASTLLSVFYIIYVLRRKQINHLADNTVNENLEE